MIAPSTSRSPAQLARGAFEAIFDRRDIGAVRPLWTDKSLVEFLALGVDASFRELLAALQTHAGVERSRQSSVGRRRRSSGSRRGGVAPGVARLRPR
jgi:hypothetical protein